MERLSVSFLVDEMRRVPGGCGPNIAYGLALLGERPLLLATAGARRRRIPRAPGAARASTSRASRLEDDLFTASFFVSTDQDQNQLASFYTGAMARARGALAARRSIRRRSPSSSSRPTTRRPWPRTPRTAGGSAIPFLYDPSQQVTRLSGEEMREGFRGAAILIVNDYEFGILDAARPASSREAAARRGPGR